MSYDLTGLSALWHQRNHPWVRAQAEDMGDIGDMGDMATAAWTASGSQLAGIFVPLRHRHSWSWLSGKVRGLVHCPSLSWKENSGKTCSGNRGDHMKPLGFASPRSIWHFASFICEVNRVGYEEYRAPPIPPLGQKHHSIEGDGDFNMVLSKKDEKT